MKNRRRMVSIATVCILTMVPVVALVSCSAQFRKSERQDFVAGKARHAPHAGEYPGSRNPSAAAVRRPGHKYKRESSSAGGLFGGGGGAVGAIPADPANRSAIPVEPGSVPSLEEEVWVIQRSPAAPIADPDAPGSGAMLAVIPNHETEAPIPLNHTDVQGRISGYIASVEVTQQFRNPYDEKIEAVYVFPLPQNAAVNEFIMTVGERRIRGIIREREEAERAYQEAKRQGYVASLLTQERANIFTQKVANIEPGKSIDVNITYFHTLSYDDGWYEFVFPTVVGPRFNPPGSTEGVGAVARGEHGRSGQVTEVQYLRPDERCGHDISLSVEIDAGVALEEVQCNSHVVSFDRPDAARAVVRLSESDSIPNKDFVLRYKVAGDRIKSALVTHRDERGGFFSLMVYPPDDLGPVTRTPMEMIFVLDCSGSMNGRPIEQAKSAIRRALKHLAPDDTFQIIRFSHDASQLGSSPLSATPKNIRRGLAYLDTLEGSGGTQMIEGIKAALNFPHDERRLRFVAFLTDGFIGNEVDILQAVHARVGASRIFSFGVGSAPNRYLMNRMAKLGRGAVAYLSLDDSPGPVIDRFFERASQPAMTDLEIDWGGAPVTDVYPARIPDLFVGRPVIVTGRFNGAAPQSIRISGRAGDQVRNIVSATDAATAESHHEGLAAVWARTRIADLADRSLYEGGGELPDEIKQVALEFGLMSAYTAFVAVDSITRTAGTHGATVAVPVSVPEGVRYETTVDE